MLSVTKHRLVYTLVFGAMADTVFNAFTFAVPFPGFSRVVASILGSELTYIAAIYSVHDNVYI